MHRTQEVASQEIYSYELQAFFQEILSIANGKSWNFNKRIKVDLAALQLGVEKRMIIFDTDACTQNKSFGELQFFINPVILWSSKEAEEDWRSRYFTKDLADIIKRTKIIEVLDWNRTGNPIRKDYCRRVARVVQLGIDHLHAICFPNRVSQDVEVLYLIEEDEFTKYKVEWRSWTNVCSIDIRQELQVV